MKKELDSFLSGLKNEFADCEDLAVRVGSIAGGRFAVVYIKEVCSRDYVSQSVLAPILKKGLSGFDGDFGGLIGAASFSRPASVPEAADGVVSGESVLLVESEKGFFAASVNARGGPGREVSEPSSDVTVRGSKAGFVESAGTNLALMRGYIRTPRLKTRAFTVGSVSNTRLILCYVKGRAPDKLVENVCERIKSLKAAVVLDSSHIAMLLSEGREPLLPVCGSTEKVDKAAAKLMAGRIAIITDGSPFVLTLPYVFAESIQSSDDYIHTPYYATFIRALRLIAFFASVFAPGVLCALVTYDYAELPPELYGVITKSREGVPVSFFWEILAVLIIFELIREVGVRMPRPVGDAVGIVGSVVLGNTAVDAGIVSSVGVITVAFAAVCAFITPTYMYVVVLFRLAVLVLAQVFGVYGLGVSAALLAVLLCTGESFGVPYLFPFSPRDKKGLQDFLIAVPHKTVGRRERLGGGK